MPIPSIDVIFQKLAVTAVQRSERGVLAMVIKDATAAVGTKIYTTLSGVTSSDYSAASYKMITQAFDVNLATLIVVNIGTASGANFESAITLLEPLGYNWLVVTESTLQAAAVSYVKSYNTSSPYHKIKLLTCGQTAVDDWHIVNIPNTNAKVGTDTATTSMEKLLPYIGAVLCSCPMTRSVTGYKLGLLSEVSSVADISASIDAGNMPLFRDVDGSIRISRGVNTLTTVTEYSPADFKKITIAEGVDLMLEDITVTFKDNYRGVYKNTADNQALFISSVLAYFRQLEKEYVLNSDFENKVDVDIDAQKAAWTAAGTDTSSWTDAQAKRKTYGSYVYLTGNVLMLDAMEDLRFVINMY